MVNTICSRCSFATLLPVGRQRVLCSCARSLPIMSCWLAGGALPAQDLIISLARLACDRLLLSQDGVHRNKTIVVGSGAAHAGVLGVQFTFHSPRVWLVQDVGLGLMCGRCVAAFADVYIMPSLYVILY
ncbi:hypothetical protein V8C86DRAFT_2781552 [Haematococcus lacustris]